MLTDLDPSLEIALWFAALVLAGAMLMVAISWIRRQKRNILLVLDDIQKMFAGNK